MKIGADVRVKAVLRAQLQPGEPVLRQVRFRTDAQGKIVGIRRRVGGAQVVHLKDFQHSTPDIADIAARYGYRQHQRRHN